MGLPNVARYPEATVVEGRDERPYTLQRPHYGEQKMSVPLQYVGGDAETAELRLLAQLQQIGYTVRPRRAGVSQTSSPVALALRATLVLLRPARCT